MRAPPTPTAKQRQVLKALLHDPAARIEYALVDGTNVWLAYGEEEEKLLPSTYAALLTHGWIAEIACVTGGEGVRYAVYRISPAGEEALR